MYSVLFNAREANMRGSFDYRKNCTLPHLIPAGMWQDGFPVIVIPGKDYGVTLGTLYDFEIRMTNSARYVLDGEVYRVAHAIYLQDVAGKEGDSVDGHLYAPTHSEAPKLGDANPQLAALMQKMQSASA